MAKSPNPISVIEDLIEVQNNVGEFVRNGPSTGLGGYVRGEYRKRCDQFANLPTWARALNPGAQGTMGRVCGPYWADSGVDGPSSVPPFTGGQCAASYAVGTLGSTTCPSGPTDFAAFTSGLGPIGSITSVRTPRQNFPANTLTTWTVNFADFSRNFSIAHNDSITPCIRVFLTTGGNDNCGDPPGELEPGTNPPVDPGPTPGPEPTENPNDPTGVPLLPVPPFEDPIGGPTAIEGDDAAADPFDPTTIPGNPDSQEGGDENIGEPIEGETGAGGSGDDVDFGEPPAGRVWVGCLLQFDIPTAYGIIPNSAPANPVAARIFGNASLVFSNARGTPYRLNGGNIDLFRPNGALKVTGVYVNSLPGITFNVRPVSILKCPENACAIEA